MILNTQTKHRCFLTQDCIWRSLARRGRTWLDFGKIQNQLQSRWVASARFKVHLVSQFWQGMAICMDTLMAVHPSDQVRGGFLRIAVPVPSTTRATLLFISRVSFVGQIFLQCDLPLKNIFLHKVHQLSCVWELLINSTPNFYSKFKWIDFVFRSTTDWNDKRLYYNYDNQWMRGWHSYIVKWVIFSSICF